MLPRRRARRRMAVASGIKMPLLGVLLLLFLSPTAAAPRALYKRGAPTPPGEQIEWTIALQPANSSGVFAELAARSDPTHALYGQWLSRDAVLSLIAPAPQHSSRVAAHHAAAGAVCAPWPSALRCAAPAAVVNALYSAELRAHSRRDGGGGSGGGNGAPVLHRVPLGAPFAVPRALEGAGAFVEGLVGIPPQHWR